MNLGRILVCGAALLAANASHAADKYEKTIDGKTTVWHNVATRRVEASWSGDRDDSGYATGKGTLTWYRAQRNWQTGTLLPEIKYIPVSRYSGTMVKGKLEGAVVTQSAKGKTYHAKFSDGEKTSDWIAGPAPRSKKLATQKAEATKVAAAPTPSASPSAQPEPLVEEKPAESIAQTSEIKEREAGTTATPGDSVQSLAMPPSTLRIGASNEASPQPSGPPSQASENTEAGTSTPSVSSAPSGSANDYDTRAVTALDSEFHTAVKTNDASTIDRILADDFVLVRGVGRSLNKNDLVKQAREKLAKYERHDIEEGSQQVRVWRDTAVVTETVWVKGIEEGKPVDHKLSVTETYARTSNGWRYVAGQASMPPK